MIGCGVLVAGLCLVPQAARLKSASRFDAEGLSLLDRGQVSEAEASFRKALEIDPQDADALNNLGVILRRRGEVDKAVEVLRGAAKAQPNDARIHSNLALALEAAGRLNEALAELKKAGSILPRDASIRRNLGILLLQAGARDEAEKELRQSLELDPRSAATRQELARLKPSKLLARRSAAGIKLERLPQLLLGFIPRSRLQKKNPQVTTNGRVPRKDGTGLLELRHSLIQPAGSFQSQSQIAMYSGVVRS